jgi:hypothetical protein
LVECLLWEQDVESSNLSCLIMCKNYRRKLDRQGVRSTYEEYMKDQKCAVCGLDDPEVLEWHHKDSSTKFGEVTHLVGKYKWHVVYAEILKCICVCANCHRKIHAKDRKKFGAFRYEKNKLTGPVLDI